MCQGTAATIPQTLSLGEANPEDRQECLSYSLPKPMIKTFIEFSFSAVTFMFYCCVHHDEQNYS
jgi:hypothetical protein